MKVKLKERSKVKDLVTKMVRKNCSVKQMVRQNWMVKLKEKYLAKLKDLMKARKKSSVRRMVRQS